MAAVKVGDGGARDGGDEPQLVEELRVQEPSSPPVVAYRAARRFFTDPRTVGVAQAGPRTAAFMARTWARSREPVADPHAVPARPSLGLAVQESSTQLFADFLKMRFVCGSCRTMS